jgi:thymidylate synthase (FAD)
MDPLFTVKTINATPAPQGLIYRALHQDYSEKFIGDEPIPDEARCGEIAVQRLLRGDRGHFGCLEHPAISFAVGWFPHSVMQQARTHRTGVTFDVQSGRYSGQRIVDLAGRIWKDAEIWNDSDIMRDDDWPAWVEEVFYLRPAGDYSDRQGARYTYTAEQRYKDLAYAADAACYYSNKIDHGFSEEHARGQLAFDFRQHFVVSFNARSLMHFLDLRSKKDAQLEIQQLCELMMVEFENWAPEIAAWYRAERLGKARLAP